ncbi:heavy metal translocating P-type ATPase [Microbacterium sp. A93]|uniref:heavy metal translocating P-type ATPase n=1 Tax=Microbacterium sp. A93 TaxID=3450716 RepID=UPI003F433099
MKFWSVVRSSPWVVATLLALVATLVLESSSLQGPARWVATAFGLGVALYTAVGMVRDLLAGHWGIDILAVTAIAATLLVGEYLAALLVCLMLTGGEALEVYAEGRAKRSLTALLERAPHIAHRLQEDGSTVDIPVAEVVVGDRLLLRPAEVVPVDGVLAGTDVVADFDESSLTGESLPVTRRSGDPVLSGALNGQQALVLEVTTRPEDSQYARILDLVREASESRSPLVRLADRYAVPFTLIAYLIGGIAWWLSGDPVRFAEVLVVATPCPLLIAAPVAFLGGMSRAAKNGVIVKSGGTLETLGTVRAAAFDKTGTLTYGHPELLDVRPEPAPASGAGLDAGELLRLAASAEQYSVHVLADSIRQAAVDRGLELITATEAREEATHGVTAELEGRLVIVGKSAYVREHTTGFRLTELRPGESAVYVGVGGVFAGTLILSDQLRANAAATLEELDRLGVTQRVMLTGDAEATARHVAAQAGITGIYAELLPEDKVRWVRGVEPGPVMMVGDGVNDAPVLAVADVGVAMGARGSTAASETADVVIIRDDISRAAVAVSVGQRTLRVAKESIWVGIALSLVLMVTAAFGVIPAIVGALLQEVVDVVAIANSLRAMRGGRHEMRDFADLQDRSGQARAELTAR